MIADYLIPGILALCACAGLKKKENVYDAMVTGASDGLRILKDIVPSLVILLCAIEMLRASGFLTIMTEILRPVCQRIGIPPETLPIMLVRPFSGSAALATGAEIMREYGVDSIIGRTAAVMLGSSETTFYTISVYFGAAGIRKTRYTLPAAMIADLTGFLTAALFTRLFFPS